jgi:hypothetical protein
MCRTAILVLTLVALTACGASAAQDSAPAQAHRKTTAAAGAHPTRRATAARSGRRAVAAETRTNHQASTAPKPTPGAAVRAASHAPADIRDDSARRDSTRNGGTGNKSLASNEEMESAEREASRTNSPQADMDLPARDEAAGAGTNRIAPPQSQEPGAGAETPGANAEKEDASLRVPRSAMPSPLRGSHESLERQNTRLDADGLERIEDEADLADRIAHKLLVPIPASSALTVNAGLPAAHRYCRPWTARFLADLARAHDTQFHRPLEVNSAVRTVEYQKRLMETNGNAAPAEGDIVSPHLTGATIDIAKDGLSRDEIAWMRRHLLELETAGKIDVEEEFQQACFHITVYKSYAPPHAPRPAAPARGGSAVNKRHKAPAPPAANDTQGL